MKEKTENKIIKDEIVDEVLEKDNSDEINYKLKFEEKEQEYKDLKDKFLRLAADFENTKKRYEKDLKDAHSFSITKFAKDIVTILDHIEIGISHIKEDSKIEEVKIMHQGMISIQNEMLKVFEKFKIEQIKPKIGDKFDPNFHQALSKVENKEFSAGSVISIICNGYKIEDRILKEAMIVVN